AADVFEFLEHASFQLSASAVSGDTNSDALQRGLNGKAGGGHEARLGRSAGLLLVALAEPLDAAGRVDELLLARQEGVAVAADLQPQLLLRGAGRPGRPARAVHGDLVIVGVDVRFHGTAHSSGRRATAQPRRPPSCRAVRPSPCHSMAYPANQSCRRTALVS